MISLLFIFVLSCVNGDTVVETNTGPVKGISLDTKNVEAFLGIPYAEPPVGNLRFAKPVSKSPWKETYEAKHLPPACIQSMLDQTAKFFGHDSIKIDEDCLYLNLWVPKTESKLRPIMIFIHGGGYMIGSSNLKTYDGANLSQHGDVIVASMNYRLGTLGFFSAFIDEAAGNMGMYDQLLAIQWIKDNAKNFGGDPDNILIFGESAGSYSVSLHMVSPLSKKLFRRGILESGSGISPMYSDDNEMLREGCKKISKLVGCATSDDELDKNPKSVVECMKNLPPEKFAEAEFVLVKKLQLLIPRVGDEFLPINPTDLYRKGEHKDTEVLLGVTRDEGTMFVDHEGRFKNDDLHGQAIDMSKFNEEFAKESIQYFVKGDGIDKIIQSYFERVNKDSRYTSLNAISDIIGDPLVTCGTVFQADFQSRKSSPVYFYLFDYRTPSSPHPDWAGVPHFEELPYVFGNPLYKPFSEFEEELSKDMMDMWVAFAKTGNPNIPGQLKWPKYTYKDPKYMIISKRDRIGVRPDDYRCEAWRKLYRCIIDE